MKARVKATGEIVEVEIKHFSDFAVYVDEEGRMYKGLYDLDFDLEENHKGSQIVPLPYEPDYWEKLKHQYAGMVMHGLLTNLGNTISPDYIVEEAEAYATALVTKLKEEYL